MAAMQSWSRSGTKGAARLGKLAVLRATELMMQDLSREREGGKRNKDRDRSDDSWQTDRRTSRSKRKLICTCSVPGAVIKKASWAVQCHQSLRYRGVLGGHDAMMAMDRGGQHCYQYPSRCCKPLNPLQPYSHQVRPMHRRQVSVLLLLLQSFSPLVVI